MSKTRGCVLEGKRYWAPLGAVAPALSLPDVSRYGNDGAFTNVTWVQLPSGLWVMEFNGVDSQVDFGGLGIDWDASSWTVEVWGLADGNVGDSRGIAGNRFGAGAATWWSLGISGGNTIRLEETGAVQHNDAFDPDGQGWQHYTLRVSGGSDMKVYRNAVITAIDFASAVDIGDTTNDFRIGRWFGATQGWDGLLSLVRVYDYALSPTEINNHYAAERSLFGV